MAAPLFVSNPPPEKLLQEVFSQEFISKRTKEEFNKRHKKFREACVQAFGGNPICEVHGEPLRPDGVVVFHGCGYPRIQGLSEAQEKLFPNSNKIVFDDCCPREEFRCVLFCASCRKASTEWRAQHPPPKLPEVINEDEYL